jgi:hypothetical protein
VPGPRHEARPTINTDGDRPLQRGPEPDAVDRALRPATEDQGSAACLASGSSRHLDRAGAGRGRPVRSCGAGDAGLALRTHGHDFAHPDFRPACGDKRVSTQRRDDCFHGRMLHQQPSARYSAPGHAQRDAAALPLSPDLCVRLARQHDAFIFPPPRGSGDRVGDQAPAPVPARSAGADGGRCAGGCRRLRRGERSMSNSAGWTWLFAGARLAFARTASLVPIEMLGTQGRYTDLTRRCLSPGSRAGSDDCYPSASVPRRWYH